MAPDLPEKSRGRKSSLFLKLKNFKSLPSISLPKLFNLRKLLKKEKSVPVLVMESSSGEQPSSRTEQPRTEQLELGRGAVCIPRWMRGRRTENLERVLRLNPVSKQYTRVDQ